MCLRVENCCHKNGQSSPVDLVILLLRLSQNKICVYLSICPPLAFTILSSLPLKLSTETQNFFCGILAQAFFRNTFKPSTVSCVLAQASASNIDQILKSKGFKSGEAGGYISLL